MHRQEWKMPQRSKYTKKRETTQQYQPLFPQHRSTQTKTIVLGKEQHSSDEFSEVKVQNSSGISDYTDGVTTTTTAPTSITTTASTFTATNTATCNNNMLGWRCSPLIPTL